MSKNKVPIAHSELRAATEHVRRAAGRNIPWSLARRLARAQALAAGAGTGTVDGERYLVVSGPHLMEAM
jgi:hypothetical protein